MKDIRQERLERAVRRDDAARTIDCGRSRLREIQVELAELFSLVDESCHYVYEACGSLREFGIRHGFTASEAVLLAAAGRAMRLAPEIRERLLAGRLTFEAAASLGRLLGDETLRKPGEDWLALAEELPLKDLKDRIRDRIAEVHDQQPTSRMTVTMTSKGRRKFERAREVACEREGKILDEGQAVEVISEHYLDSFDPDRRGEGTRRIPDTEGLAGRTIPAEVKRKVRERARRNGGVGCEVPGCPNRVFLQYAHLKPHAHGGSREPGNLCLLCGGHHTLLDAGWIRAEIKEGEIAFYRRRGREAGGGWERVRAPPGG